MRCYKDRTYCGFRDCKKFSKCVDALTDAVHLEANMRNMNISQYVEKPECYEQFEDELLHNSKTQF